MILKKLCAENFRNLKSVCFEPTDGINILFGDNAQGKTNLIEAIWLFSGARSFRASKDAEFINFGAGRAKLTAEFTSHKKLNVSSIVFSPAEKQATLNGIKLSGTSSLAGNFCAVVFSPDHLELVKSGPQHRRKFIDCAISAIWPRHTVVLNEYKNILKQRNALLKDIPLHSELIDTLPIWDKRLVQAGSLIVFARLRYLSRLKELASAFYDGISSKDSEKLDLSYESLKMKIPDDLSNQKEAIFLIRSKLEYLLASERHLDIEAGLTRIGPHRDDIKISINGVDSRLYSSQGQQRSAVLSLKLAEAAMLKETVMESPVLLLDDVLSELDRKRQLYILNNIGGFQVFISCCDPSGFEKLKKGALFEVKNGKIERLN